MKSSWSIRVRRTGQRISPANTQTWCSISVDGRFQRGAQRVVPARRSMELHPLARRRRRRVGCGSTKTHGFEKNAGRRRRRGDDGYHLAFQGDQPTVSSRLVRLVKRSRGFGAAASTNFLKSRAILNSDIASCIFPSSTTQIAIFAVYEKKLALGEDFIHATCFTTPMSFSITRNSRRRWSGTSDSWRQASVGKRTRSRLVLSSPIAFVR